MTVPPVRIAMWSGPRNISTAMMRAFEHRPDTAVIDEPFYAAYLHRTGLDHPLRTQILTSQPTDPARIVETLTGPVPGGRAVFYQKHMTHHMLPGIDRGWMRRCENVFLIRAPEAVLASYAAKRIDVALADIGFVQQAEMFDQIADRLGRAPPVIDADRILADPRHALSALCGVVGIAFDDAMLRWPAGPRATDGIWGPAWYDAVERSTGFAVSSRAASPVTLSAPLRVIADRARAYYERLAQHAI